jgi:hypothetical protein
MSLFAINDQPVVTALSVVTETSHRSPAHVDINNQSAVTSHGKGWFEDDESTQLSINGVRVSHSWILFDAFGNQITKEIDRGRAEPGGRVECSRTKLEYFLLMFPPKQIDDMIQYTNKEMRKLNSQATNDGELLKFFGILILATRFEFGNRATLWKSSSPSMEQLECTATASILFGAV